MLGEETRREELIGTARDVIFAVEVLPYIRSALSASYLLTSCRGFVSLQLMGTTFVPSSKAEISAQCIVDQGMRVAFG